MTIGSGLWIPAGVIHRHNASTSLDDGAGDTRRVRVSLSMSDPPRPLRDVQITAPEGTQLAELVDVLANGPGMAVRPATVWSGSRGLEPTARLGGPGLRNGAILRFGGPSRQTSTSAPLQVAVVGGPDAGKVVPLTRSETVVGRASSCDLPLSDPEVSRRHLALAVTRSGIRVRDLRSTNGTRIEGHWIDPPESAASIGDTIQLGDSTLAVTCAHEGAAALTSATDGTLLVNRPPSAGAEASVGEIDYPDDRDRPSTPHIPWLAALLPAALGVALAVIFHAAQYLAFALLSPVMLMGSAAGDRWRWWRGHRRAAARLAQQQADVNRRSAELLIDETLSRRRSHPDAASVLRTASVPDCRVWERRLDQPGFGTVRLGLADQASRLKARRGGNRVSAGILRSVPFTVNLRAESVGLAGPFDVARSCARWLVGQLAVAHSPADLRFVFLVSDSSEEAWTWTRWLPHDRSVAVSPSEHAATTAALRSLVDTRLTDRGTRTTNSWSGPWTVLVVDPSGDLVDVPGLVRLLGDGTQVGVSGICVDDRIRRLPASCSTVAAVDDGTGTSFVVRRPDSSVVRRVSADQVTTHWAERVARGLAPLADAGGDTSATIPATCFLFDLLGLDRGNLRSAIVEYWRSGAGRPRTAVGLSAQGLVELDLISDGPHVLVAGTTGSGKSEFLRSLVAGLSIANGPGDIALLLIDYKGGATFADCGQLPHTVGVVTDLDAHLTRRVLRSLDAELRRREVLFARVGARDLDQYRRTIRPHASLHRLVLIVDEFAALAEELPDFLDGLIDIAQRGRSLGIHLVLATQRPGGVISPEIRANTALRVALRVTDPNESADVIGTTAAAAIDKNRPGRACVRTGSTVIEMQTGRVADAAQSTQRIRVESLDRWGRPITTVPSDFGRTDLQLLADAAQEATVITDARLPNPPWLPPLPDTLPIGAIVDGSPDLVPVGMVDLPDTQQQMPLLLDLSRAGPYLVIGAAGSGRTTFLNTAVAAAASRLSSESLQVYAIDCAGGGLQALVDLPHCVAVLSRDDFEAVERLIARLTLMAAERRIDQANEFPVGAADVAAQTTQHNLMLVLDGWESFVSASDEHDGGRTVDALLSLLRDAASIGMTVLITGDRTTLAPRLAGIVSRRFVLRLVDRADFALAGIPPHRVPLRMPPGRAIRSDDHAEAQFAVLGCDPSYTEQCRAIAGIAAATKPRAIAPVINLRPLPRRVRLAALGPVDLERPTLGVGGDGAEPIRLNLFAGPGTFLVAGPPRSGRTTALTVLGMQLNSANIEILVAAPTRSELARFAYSAGVPVWNVDADPDLLTVASRERRVILVDDAEMFVDTAVGAALTDIVRRTGADQVVVVAARTDDLAVSYRGLQFEVQRGRTGLLLQPAAADGEVFGVRLKRSRTSVLPGRGLLVGNVPRLTGLAVPGGLIPVQVATP